jgi:TonB family protein
LDTKRKQVPIRIERVDPVANHVVHPDDILKLSLAKGIKNDKQIARPLQFDLNKKLLIQSNPSENINLPIQVEKNASIDLGGKKLVQSPIVNSSVKIKGSISPQIPLDETKSKPKTTTQTFITGPLSNRIILHKSIPKFPLWAKKQGVGATISIQFTVMENGKVKEIAIVQHTSGSSEWDQLVVKALKQWKFAALDKTDVRHDQTGVITFQFVI